MCIKKGMGGIWINICGFTLVIIGAAAAFALPTDFMNSSEAIFARFIVSLPVIMFGLIVIALGRIACLLETSLVNKETIPKNASDENLEDQAVLDSQVEDRLANLMASALVLDEVADKKPENIDVSKLSKPSTIDPLTKNTQKDLATQKALDIKAITEQSSEVAVKEGEISGRKYRLYADGSLEIDTIQSTIRFDSIEEFRVFVQNPENF